MIFNKMKSHTPPSMETGRKARMRKNYERLDTRKLHLRPREARRVYYVTSLLLPRREVLDIAVA
jgi:hypothetical protein